MKTALAWLLVLLCALAAPFVAVASAAWWLCVRVARGVRWFFCGDDGPTVRW